MKIKELVMDKLIRCPETRDNDNLLIAMVMEDLYGTTNLYTIAKHTSTNHFESVRRTRQLIQKENPLLQGSVQVVDGRKQKEKRIRKMCRQW